MTGCDITVAAVGTRSRFARLLRTGDIRPVARIETVRRNIGGLGPT